MRIRKLDSRYDMQFGLLPQSSEWLVDSPEAVAHVVRTRLHLWLGEWFANLSLGFPWLQSVLVKGATEDSVARAFRKGILETQGVKDIVSLSVALDRARRKATVDVRILTMYSKAIVTVTANA